MILWKSRSYMFQLHRSLEVSFIWSINLHNFSLCFLMWSQTKTQIFDCLNTESSLTMYLLSPLGLIIEIYNLILLERWSAPALKMWVILTRQKSQPHSRKPIRNESAKINPSDRECQRNRKNPSIRRNWKSHSLLMD